LLCLDPDKIIHFGFATHIDFIGLKPFKLPEYFIFTQVDDLKRGGTAGMNIEGIRIKTNACEVIAFSDLALWVAVGQGLRYVGSQGWVEEDLYIFMGLLFDQDRIQ